jgi:hypothetical protein
MPQIAWRIIIVVIVAVFLTLLVPPILGLLGITLAGNAYQIIKICLALIAVFYIIWGGPVSFPPLRG